MRRWNPRSQHGLDIFWRSHPKNSLNVRFVPDLQWPMCAGVHEIAALRMVAEAAGGGAPLRAVATTSHDPDAGLTDPDTLMGLVEWQSGLCSSVCITLASAFVRSFPLTCGHSWNSCMYMSLTPSPPLHLCEASPPPPPRPLSPSLCCRLCSLCRTVACVYHACD